MTEHQAAQLLMLKAALTLCIQKAMWEGVLSDVELVHHLVHAKLRVEDLLAGKEKAA